MSACRSSDLYKATEVIALTLAELMGGVTLLGLPNEARAGGSALPCRAPQYPTVNRSRMWAGFSSSSTAAIE